MTLRLVWEEMSGLAISLESFVPFVLIALYLAL